MDLVKYSNLPKVKISLDTSDDDIDKELYLPCLRWATHYDRGVGYFTTGWMQENLVGLSDFASRGGKVRLITSPIITNNDYDAILKAEENGNDEAYKLLQEALKKNVETLAGEMEKDLFNAFAWMIHDGIIDIRFAIPVNKLEEGNFHDKFGIFSDDEGNALSFSGSQNDSKKGFSNYESIKVFKTWAGTDEYVESDRRRFEKIWNKKDNNVKLYSTSQGVKDKIFELHTEDRPYKTKKNTNKWRHQDIAVDTFLEKKNGILAMATGTGKTATAKKIIKKLFSDETILRVIISMSGNDLLDQWAKQMRDDFSDKPCYLHYGAHKEMAQFITHPDSAILLVSSESGNLSKLLNMLDRFPGDFYGDTLFVFDEVHGLGSATRVENLTGRLEGYTYRLGLSATPEREYDEEGNAFIETEIGPVIYTFSLKDAIERGILCPFNYTPLGYELTDEEKEKKKKIIANFNMRKKQGELVSETDMYTQLSHVNKTAENKLYAFRELLNQNPSILDKCIIFVQTREYGEKVQEILLDYIDDYHTYYADDEKTNLENFAKGKLNCLLTCKKVSEGIDISRVSNIVLFSSDRSKLVTTQRIGRALRLDPNNDEKIATVVDFVMETDSEDTTADSERQEWLTSLSKIRRRPDEE